MGQRLFSDLHHGCFHAACLPVDCCKLKAVLTDALLPAWTDLLAGVPGRSPGPFLRASPICSQILKGADAGFSKFTLRDFCNAARCDWKLCCMELQHDARGSLRRKSSSLDWGGLQLACSTAPPKLLKQSRHPKTHCHVRRHSATQESSRASGQGQKYIPERYGRRRIKNHRAPLLSSSIGGPWRSIWWWNQTPAPAPSVRKKVP